MTPWEFPDQEPYDDHVGPFPSKEFVDAWWATIGSGNPSHLTTEKSFLPMVEAEGVLSIAGDADLTDYHSPLGPDPAGLGQLLADARDHIPKVVLNSLPEGSAMAIQSALEAVGIAPVVEQEISTAVISVEDEYLSGLSRKQRHEVRRKHRRFLEGAGEPELVTWTGEPAALERFIGMHRRSAGDKADFFDGARADFFALLNESAGWEITELTVGGSVCASLFGFRETDAYYLYNSAYEPSYREVSPGVVMLYLQIDSLVESGCNRIDLLKGDEIYKFRMGAEARPLYRIEI